MTRNHFFTSFTPLYGLLLLCTSMAGSLWAQSSPDAVAILATYEKVWKEKDSTARLPYIRTIWTEESYYEDPAETTRGIASFNRMITAFHKQFPNAILESSPPLYKGTHYTWSWKIYAEKDKLLVSGRDYMEINDKGKILKLIGFWDASSGSLPTSELDKQVVGRYFECLFKTQDMTTLASTLAEKATYYQATGLPYGGTYVGFAEWKTMFDKAKNYFKLAIRKEPVYLTDPASQTITLLFEIACTSRKTGKTIEMPISEVFTLQDGKITTIRPYYFDTKAFSEFLK